MIAALFLSLILSFQILADTHEVIKSDSLTHDEEFIIEEIVQDVVDLPPRRKRVGIDISAGMTGGEFVGSGSGFVINSGFNWRAGVIYRPFNWLALHAGYNQNQFECKRGFCVDDSVIFKGTAIDAGLTLRKFGMMAGGGIKFEDFDISWNNGSDRLSPQKSNPAYFIRGGFYLPVGRSLELEASAVYGMYSGTYQFSENSQRINYLNSEFRLRFYLF